ncbi:GIN domain-containing protein [Fibrella sp. WM1]|uniref:GIN domain-containing protein n=1 Tax=Fibrella musci TaxID=3242485 RepID=UPI003521C6EF
MKTIAILMALTLPLGLQAQSGKYDPATELRGSGQIIRSTKTVAAFDAIEVSQFPAQITVEVGATTESSVTLSADDNLQPLVRIVSENGTLRLFVEEAQNKRFWISKASLRVVVKTPQLNRFTHGSNSDVVISGLQNKSFDLVNEANGEVTLRGRTDTFKLASSANGTVHAETLTTQTADIVTQANATIRINAQTVKAVSLANATVINVAKRGR